MRNLASVRHRAFVRVGLFVVLVSVGWDAQAHQLGSVYLLTAAGFFEEYDLKRSTSLRRIQAPAELNQNPSNPWLILAIDRYGQMALCDILRGPIWIFSGEGGLPSPLPARRKWTRDHAESIDVFLSGRKGVYFVASNSHDYIFAKESHEAGESTVKTRFSLKEYSFDGAPGQEVLHKDYPVCRCSTGDCSESCPEGRIAAPGGVIDSAFVFMSWVEGQLESRTEEALLYTRDGPDWSASSRLPTDSHIMDIGPDSTLLEAIGDNGCCGWENGSNNLAFVRVSSGARVQFYDEYARHGNQEIDVSFFTSALRFSPSGQNFAHQVSASPCEGDNLRWSSDHEGTEQKDPLKFARIADSCRRHPATEIFHKDGTLLSPVPNENEQSFAFGGWLDDQTILLAGENKLRMFNTMEKHMLELTIPGLRATYMPQY